MIVRARPKALADVAPEYRCCSGADAARKNEEVFVETTKTSISDVRCHFCGHLMKDVVGMQIIGEPDGHEIVIAIWELDEGETTPAEFLQDARP